MVAAFGLGCCLVNLVDYSKARQAMENPVDFLEYRWETVEVEPALVHYDLAVGISLQISSDSSPPPWVGSHCKVDHFSQLAHLDVG